MTTQVEREIADMIENATKKGKAVIAAQAAEIAELRGALENMCDEFLTDDHNLAYPRCNCESHQKYHSARAILASTGAK